MTDTQEDRQADKQADRQTDKQAGRQEAGSRPPAAPAAPVLIDADGADPVARRGSGGAAAGERAAQVRRAQRAGGRVGRAEWPHAQDDAGGSD